MDRAVILDKLDSLRRCVARVESNRTATVEELLADIDRQDILTLNLTRAVQLMVDIAAHITTGAESRFPATMGASLDRLKDTGVLDGDLHAELRKSIGFRNIVVHAYRDISWHMVHDASYAAPDQLREFSSRILKHLDGAQERPS